MSLKYLQSNTLYQAGAGNIIGATTVVLTSFADIYGNTISSMAPFGVKGYITLEPDTTNEEGATFTGVTANANGTVSLTGISTILAQFPYTETSGLVRQHSGGTKVVVTDNVAFWNTFGNTANINTWTDIQTFSVPPISATNPTGSTQIANKAYVDGVAIAGGADASSTIKGITKLSVNPVSTTSPIAVGDNDTRVPTQNENDALVGTSGTAVSSANKLVDNADTTGTGLVTRTSYVASLITTAGTYGDGSDGAMTADGSTSYAAFSSLSGSIYTLTRDTFLTNLIGNTGVSIDTGGFQLFISGTLTQNGTFKITANGGAGGAGGNGSGTTAGAAGTAGAARTGVTVPSTTAGVVGIAGATGSSNAVGTNGNNSGAGTAGSTNSLGSSGATASGTAGGAGTGATGAGTATTGGSPGTAGAISSVAITRPNSQATARMYGYFRSGAYVQFNGSAGNTSGPGGASGGSGTGSTSGGGGGGGGSGAQGGFLIVYARAITVNPGVTLFQAKGGAGGNGGNAGASTGSQVNGSGGGGCGLGGNGGFAIVFYNTKTGAITYDVSAGANGTNGLGAAGLGLGPTGTNGSISGTPIAGVSYEINS